MYTDSLRGADKFYDLLVDIKKEGIQSKIDKHLRGKYIEKLLSLLKDVLHSLLAAETTAVPLEMEETQSRCLCK